MKWKIAIGILVAVLISIVPGTLDHNLHVTICDIGQGDSIVIQTPDKKIFLIDGGPDDKVLSCLGERTPFYQRTIEAIFISHLHADHTVGIIEVLKRYNTKNLIVNKINQKTPEVTELYKNASEGNLIPKSIFEEDTFTLRSGITGRVYYPNLKSWNTENGEWQAYLDDFNDSSLVFSIIYGSTMMLFTGDAGSKVLDEVAQEQLFQQDVKATQNHILKVPHHGSKDGISESLLEVFKPDLAVMSLGKENTFGHPHKETLESYKKHNIKLLRTDQNGNIDISIEEDKVGITLDKSSK